MKKITLLMLILSGCGAFAQFHNGLWTGKQANNWYWSFNQGLTFNSGSPEFLSDGQTSVMEGTAVMSDENGQLLFYVSNGTVWNKNHVTMQNGSNMLAGDQSSTQSGIIIPKPGNPGIYYLFNEDIYDGLVYSVIDMSLDNGLGAVTDVKNIVLEPNARNEKLTAVYHTDHERIWMVSHREANNEFIAYLVSSEGIAATPVVSAVGMSYTTEAPSISVTYNDGGSAGQLKASPDGTKLASVQRIGEISGASIINGTIEVFDFNAATGEIANPVQIGIPNSAFGIEFSPNSHYLYILDNQYMPWVGWLGTTFEKMYQYDLQAANIPASATMIGQYTSRYSSALQLAPDGKIYMMNSASLNTLVAVSYPNNAGTAAGLTANVLTLLDADSIGLPTFNQSYFQSGILYTANCGNDVAFELLRIPGVTAVEWNFGDPASGAGNISTVAQHTFSSPGTYTVTATITSNGATQIATQQVTVGAGAVFTVPQNLSACAENGSALFNLGQQTAVILTGLDATLYTVAYYTSAEDAANGTNAISNTAAFTSSGQTIYVTATEIATACSSTLQFNLVVTPAPAVPQLPALTQCGSSGIAVFNLTQQEAIIAQPGASVSYFTSAEDATANTNAIANAQAFTNTVNPQTIYVGVVSGACAATGQFQISILPAPEVPQFPAMTSCAAGNSSQAVFNLTQQEILVTQTGVAVTYFTTADDATANINAIANPIAYSNITNPQTIYVRLANADCTATGSFMLNVSPLPVLPSFPDLRTCATDSNNQEEFNLTQQQALITQQGVTLGYFTTNEDAAANTNAIADASAFTNTVNPQTIYIRASNGECFATGSFALEVTPMPAPFVTTQLFACPPADITAATAGNSSGLQFTYYTTEADAVASANAIADAHAYVFEGTTATVYIRAQNTEGCFSINPVTVLAEGCMIPRGISPNGDEKNDDFDLTYFDVRKLIIYNRYGLEVYSRNNYTNQWHGQTNSGNELPTGVYYYVVEVTTGSSKTGWVYVNRESR